MHRFNPAALVLMLLTSCTAAVCPTHEEPPPHKGSAAFESMESLAGHWTGTVTGEEEKLSPATASYRVTSNGNAVIETIFEGTSMEMTSMYFERDGKLMMTHSCAIGNRPTLALSEAKGETLRFDFMPSDGIDPVKDLHIHGLQLRMNPDGSIRESWTGYQNGKEGHPTVLSLRRDGR